MTMHPTIWDRRADFYKDTFISPFADEMTARDGNRKCRNLLLDHIRVSPKRLSEMRVADFGCGPGNLLEHLQGRIPHIDGIDLSRRSLEIAVEKALTSGVDFTAVEADLRTYRADIPYDLIFSVNSVLPPDRESVLQILRTVHDNLAPEGEFWTILPSFDTTEHLDELLYQEALEANGIDHAEKTRREFRAEHRMDIANMSYSDDGVLVKCFHTPDSIAREMKQAGLELVQPMQKVYYPWALSKRFGYGYFPGQEEIWDWFAVAKAAD